MVFAQFAALHRRLQERFAAEAVIQALSDEATEPEVQGTASRLPLSGRQLIDRLPLQQERCLARYPHVPFWPAMAAAVLMVASLTLIVLRERGGAEGHRRIAGRNLHRYCIGQCYRRPVGYALPGIATRAGLSFGAPVSQKRPCRNPLRQRRHNACGSRREAGGAREKRSRTYPRKHCCCGTGQRTGLFGSNAVRPHRGSGDGIRRGSERRPGDALEVFRGSVRAEAMGSDGKPITQTLVADQAALIAGGRAGIQPHRAPPCGWCRTDEITSQPTQPMSMADIQRCFAQGFKPDRLLHF